MARRTPRASPAGQPRARSSSRSGTRRAAGAAPGHRGARRALRPRPPSHSARRRSRRCARDRVGSGFGGPVAQRTRSRRPRGPGRRPGRAAPATGEWSGRAARRCRCRCRRDRSAAAPRWSRAGTGRGLPIARSRGRPSRPPATSSAPGRPPSRVRRCRAACRSGRRAPRGAAGQRGRGARCRRAGAAAPRPRRSPCRSRRGRVASTSTAAWGWPASSPHRRRSRWWRAACRRTARRGATPGSSGRAAGCRPPSPGAGPPAAPGVRRCRSRRPAAPGTAPG